MTLIHTENPDHVYVHIQTFNCTRYLFYLLSDIEHNLAGPYDNASTYKHRLFIANGQLQNDTSTSNYGVLNLNNRAKNVTILLRIFYFFFFIQ